jgi:hypothetical protein
MAKHEYWRYLPGGTVKHALLYAESASAVCGQLPSWFRPEGWFGTGSQDEYETVERLPACKRCVAKGYLP